MATGAKRSVILGKVTQNGTPAPRNGNGNGTATTTVLNGAAHGSSSVLHKAKAARSSKVSRTPVPTKVKAAAR